MEQSHCWSLQQLAVSSKFLRISVCEDTSSASCSFACSFTLARQSSEDCGSVIQIIQDCLYTQWIQYSSMQSASETAGQNREGRTEGEREETCYRWVIVGLVGLSQLLIGLANNAVIPLERKIAAVYGLSDATVSGSVILSFLAFSLFNFPANHVIDAKGLRASFLIGSAFYSLGTLLYCLINQSYYFVVIGTVMLGVGQPFLLNCPAKVAAFWFFPRNRALATALMVATNLLGVGAGFLVPTLSVREESVGETAKEEIWQLYLGYSLFSFFCLALNFLLMKSKPDSAPSEGAEVEKMSSTLQSLQVITKDNNLRSFFLAYFLSYGTFVAFASNCNFIIKPYGYSDVEIATNAVCLMLAGTCGAISFSLFIKKTFNFSLVLRIISLGSTILLVVLCLWLNSINNKPITTFIISLLGFFLTPLVPISYDLGCELAFPMGQAQVTGLLNGGALLWAFLTSTLIASIVGFGSRNSSLITMLMLSLFILAGSVLFFKIKIDLKRRSYEQSQKSEGRTQEDDIGSSSQIEISQNDHSSL